MASTVGQLMINAALPEPLRDPRRVLDKNGVKDLLQRVAEEYPDQYREIAHKLSNIGRDAAYTTGSYSFGLKSLRQSLAARRMRLELGRTLDEIYGSSAADKVKEQKILDAVSEYQGKLPGEVLEEARQNQNPLALQAISGARGNKFNVNALLGADLLYTDHRGRPIPVPILHSYSMGLRPHEYFAGAFGARHGVLALKTATADAGAFGKQLTQAAHRLLVSQQDDDNPYDEASPRGLPVDTDDADSVGALLAHPVGGYARNTLLTPRILKELRAAGEEQILVRSPTVGGPADGGVYARDVGVRERGRLSPVGDWVGISAAAATAEPLTQAQICLSAGTLVRMADLSERAIEDVKPGELVLGADRDGQTFPVSVLQVYDNGLRDCVQTGFRPLGHDLDSTLWLVSTPDHKVLVRYQGESRVLPVEKTRGTRAIVYGSGRKYAERMPWAAPVGARDTYDLEVDHPDHLFVLANGLIVSNSAKHSGGVAGAGAGAISGFAAINRLVQVPKNFPGGAAHSQYDGRVTEVRPAPQGGFYVRVGSQDHYVRQGQSVSVKPGDDVEAGDVLSEGVPNPAEIVRHKGVGEGRRYFVHAFRQAMRDASTTHDRRNLELLARGLINHVRLTDEVGDWAPDDVVPYQNLESQWQPRPGHLVVPPSQAKGYYLERPILHYTVGTRVQPSMLAQMQKYKVPRLFVHKDPPPFEPEMIRGMASASYDPDPLVRMLGGYQEKSLLESARRGAVSDELGSSYVPALVAGENFGKTPLTKGWTPNSQPGPIQLD